MFAVLDDVLSFVFLPARLICSLTLGRLISFFILPAQIMYQSDYQLDDIELNTDILADKHVVSDKDQYVIYIGGNGESGTKDYLGVYNQDFYLNDENIKTHLIKFNLPGVFLSPGAPNCYNDLVDASERVVEKLLAKGIRSDQIILHGLSLGGAISLYTYKKMLDKGITLGGIFNDRSFSTLSDAVLGMIGISLYESNIISKLFYIILKPLVKAILWLCMWEMEPYSIYKEIENSRKDFIAVENNEKFRDGIIHHGASMYTAINNDSDNDISEHLFYFDKNKPKRYIMWPWSSIEHMAPELNCNHYPDAKHQNYQDYFHDFQRKIYSVK